jgi:hypothetical protein
MAKQFADEEEDEKPTNKKVASDDEDEGEEKPRKKAAHVDDDEDEDRKPIGRKKKAVSDDDDDDEKPRKKKAAASDDDDDDTPRKSKSRIDDDPGEGVEFGDTELMKRKGILERLNIEEKGHYRRFAILNVVKPRKGNIHYKKGAGYAFCHSTDEHVAKCCEVLGDPTVYFSALVVHYVNAASKSGKLDPERDIEFDIKWVRLSQTNYQQVSTAPDEDGSVFDLDYVMTPRTQGKGVDIKRISSKAAWKRNPELKAAVEAAAAPFADGKALRKGLGKKLTPAEMRVFLGDAEADDDDMDDMDV